VRRASCGPSRGSTDGGDGGGTVMLWSTHGRCCSGGVTEFSAPTGAPDRPERRGDRAAGCGGDGRGGTDGGRGIGATGAAGAPQNVTAPGPHPRPYELMHRRYDGTAPNCERDVRESSARGGARGSQPSASSARDPEPQGGVVPGGGEAERGGVSDLSAACTTVLQPGICAGIAARRFCRRRSSVG
jgi:hypothetical protein